MATVEDNVSEDNETFIVGLTVSNSPSGVTSTDTGTGTITDDDTGASVNLSISPSTLVESASATVVTVIASLSNSNTLSTDMIVNVTVGASGTATSGTDYTAVPNFDLTIPAGQTSGTGTFTLSPTQDVAVEGNETITVSGTSTILSVNATTLTLIDDDVASPVNLSVDLETIDEGSSSVTVTVTATLTGNTPLVTSRTLQISVGSGGTATEGIDYSAVPNFDLTLAAGAFTGTGTFTLTPIQDTDVEGSETIEISGSAAGITVNPVSITFTDDDDATVTVNDASAIEGNGMLFTVTLNKGVPGGLTVSPTYTHGTTSSGDYSTNTELLTFVGIENETQTFVVNTTDDAILEEDETFTVDLTVLRASANVTSAGTGTGTITNDDTATLTITDASTSEGDPMIFTITLDNAVQDGFEIRPVYANTTASSSDYVANSTVVPFDGNVGESRTFTVNTTEDALWRTTRRLQSVSRFRVRPLD